jgi:hypothetical protein
MCFTHIARTLDEVKAKFGHDIVFVAQDLSHTSRDPPVDQQVSKQLCSSRSPNGASLFDHLQIHLGEVNFLIELWWEFGRTQQLRIHASCHGLSP